MNPLCSCCSPSFSGSISLSPNGSSSSSSSSDSSGSLSSSEGSGTHACVCYTRLSSGEGHVETRIMQTVSGHRSRSSAARVLCVAAEHGNFPDSIPSSIEIGFLGSRGRSWETIAAEGYVLSEILGGASVTAICEGTSQICCFLSPVSSDHPVVRALLETWCNFFTQNPQGRYLQVYVGSAGAFLEEAFRLFLQRCPYHARRIYVVGIGVSSFVPSAMEARYYRVSCDFFTYFNFRDFYRENAQGRVLTIPYSPDLSSLVPAALDASYDIALRTEVMRLLGVSSLAAPCISWERSTEERHQLVYVSVVNPGDADLSEESWTFQWVQSLLNTPRTEVEAEDNGSPSGVHERTFFCLLQASRAVTWVCMVGTRTILNMGWDDAPTVFCASSYFLNGVGGIILWVTNSRTRRQNLRCLRVLARFFSDLARVSGYIEFIDCMRFGVMDLRNHMTTPGGMNRCVLFNSVWSMTLLTELTLADLLPHYGGSVYSFFQRLFIRWTHPHLYSGIMRALSGRDEERGLTRNESTVSSVSETSTTALIRSGRDSSVITRQESAAIRTANFVFDLVFSSIALSIGFLGIDLSAIRILPMCRQECGSSTESNITHSLGNCTTTPIYAYLGNNYTYPGAGGLFEDASVYNTARTVRLVFQTVFLFYYLYVLFSTIRRSRHRR